MTAITNNYRKNKGFVIRIPDKFFYYSEQFLYHHENKPFEGNKLFFTTQNNNCGKMLLFKDKEIIKNFIDYFVKLYYKPNAMYTYGWVPPNIWSASLLKDYQFIIIKFNDLSKTINCEYLFIEENCPEKTIKNLKLSKDYNNDSYN